MHKITKILFLFILLSINNAYSQIKISGKLDKSNQNSKIYLKSNSSIDDFFSGSSHNIVDSSEISKEGKFSFSSSLEANTIYTLNIVSKGTSPGFFIQDGTNDNYAFFTTGNNLNSDIYISANMNSLFLTYKIQSTDKEVQVLNNSILSIREIMLPMHNKLESLITQMKQIPQTDTLALFQFQQNVPKLIAKTRSKITFPLEEFMKTQTNENVLSLAAAFYGVGTMASEEELRLIQKVLEPYSNRKLSPLLQSVLNKIVIFQKDYTMDFLNRNYQLIDGSVFNIKSVESDFILLNFWASWCLPCRKSIRNTLKNLSTDYDTKQLTIIGINTDEDKQKAIEAIELDQNKNIQIYDEIDNYLQKHMDVSFLPTYILIDVKNETIVKRANLEEVIEFLENQF